MSTRLALAIDAKSRTELSNYIEQTEGKDIVLKFGLKTLPLYSSEEWKDVFSRRESFVDAKLHDIPDQVAGAVKAWCELGAKYITIHTQGGPAMIEAALNTAEPYGTKILGVSVLTSLDEADLKSMGLGLSVSDYVSALVSSGAQAGLSAYVSSVHEAELVAKVLKENGKTPFHVCPGVSFGGHAGSDQKRVVDLSTAKEKGVDMVVMGRSITNTPNFVDTLEKVLDELRA